MQPIAKDFYSVLGIPPGTSKEDIRQAYWRLARQYHPDMNADPHSRDRFEEIHQAYTILSDDEARFIYQFYCEIAEEDDRRDLGDPDGYQDAPLSWWQRHTSTLGLGLAATCVLAAYGLVLYMPHVQRRVETISSVTVPPPLGATSGQPVRPSKTEATPISEVKAADPLMLETPARAYEILAYHALIVGDLTQFKNAIDLAHRADASFNKLNSLILSYQQLQSKQVTPENMLQSLRRQVLRENAARLTPSQLESLKLRVQNQQSLENS
ncbi:MAG: J domain-containing protein [Gloeobacterales cyanobacterium]